MNWSGPNCDFKGRKSQFGPFWTKQNCFGHVEGQGIKTSIFTASTQGVVMRDMFKICPPIVLIATIVQVFNGLEKMLVYQQWLML